MNYTDREVPKGRQKFAQKRMEAIRELLAGMDVPTGRYQQLGLQDTSWLLRNLGIDNSHRAGFTEAHYLIEAHRKWLED